MTIVASKEAVKKTMPRHRILREMYRHYTELKAYIAANGGDQIIYHSYAIYDEDGEQIGKEDIAISFWDLHDSLKVLSDRKREAVYLNVIKDLKQKDVAARMGITTVSVGQYVDQAMQQLAKEYFAEDDENN
jgi:DNA-directed RNA polymerase specialized sigma24 family protein